MANSANPEINKKIATSALGTLVIATVFFYLGDRYAETLVTYPGQIFDHLSDAFLSMWQTIKDAPFALDMTSNSLLFGGACFLIIWMIWLRYTLLYEQVLRLFPKNRDSIKSLITNLVKQGRIIHDKENDLLCDTAESASNPDYGMIAAFWVLLDFKKAVVYHTSGDFPIKLNFFSKDEWYEILYIPLEQEYLINHVMESQSADQVKRLVVLENEGQARKVTIDNVVAFCLVDTTSGVVSYYTKK